MDLRTCILTNNNCYKTGKTMTPKGVMWHSTAANNPNLKRYVQPDDGRLGVNQYGNHWNQAKPDGRSVCVHAFIGKDKDGNVCTYQTLPWTYRGWHCGGSGNNSYIGFEICEDDLSNKEYFDKVYREAVELTAFLCKTYGLDPHGANTIICHQDGYKLGIASNHSDVYHWFNRYGKTMDNVRNDVAAAMGQAVSSGSGSSSSGGSSSGSSSSSGTASRKIKVDGKWGRDTTLLLQFVFNLPIQDGKVSNQRKEYKQAGCYTGWEWKNNPTGYSDLIKAIQKLVGAKVDGWIGPKTIKAMQAYWGTVQDGKISAVSDLVKAMQRWANAKVA